MNQERGLSVTRAAAYLQTSIAMRMFYAQSSEYPDMRESLVDIRVEIFDALFDAMTR
jgi:hypothetical protein